MDNLSIAGIFFLIKPYKIHKKARLYKPTEPCDKKSVRYRYSFNILYERLPYSSQNGILYKRIRFPLINKVIKQVPGAPQNA